MDSVVGVARQEIDQNHFKDFFIDVNMILMDALVKDIFRYDEFTELEARPLYTM